MPLLLEYWKPVVGWEGVYEVSIVGTVRRVVAKGWHPPGSIIKGSLHSRGYWVVGLTRDNKMRHHYVHRIVCEAFVGPCPHDREVNHIDGNKLNNRLSNLEYLTHAANMQHAHAAGVFYKNFRRKLSAESVRMIRQAPSSITDNQLAIEHGVTERTIHLVRCGLIWKWVDRAVS